jgi:hypothetical protein
MISAGWCRPAAVSVCEVGCVKPGDALSMMMLNAARIAFLKEFIPFKSVFARLNDIAGKPSIGYEPESQQSNMQTKCLTCSLST